MTYIDSGDSRAAANARRYAPEVVTRRAMAAMARRVMAGHRPKPRPKPPVWPDPREVLMALAEDIRMEANKRMRRDQQWKANVVKAHPVLSHRFRALMTKRGHSVSTALSIAAQIEKRCDRWADL